MHTRRQFRDTLLISKYREAEEKNEILEIDFDGCYGFGTSFLEEAFGGLARETKNPKIREIKIISEEEPTQIEKVKGYINDALGDKK